MVAREIVGRLRIAPRDRGDDLHMLVDEALGQAVLVGLVVEAQDAPALVEQTVE